MKKIFLFINKIVEIKTSIAIFTSVCIGTLYGFYESNQFDVVLFLAMLICGVALDALSTVFNNIYDYYKAIDKEGYLYTTHNPIVYYKVPVFYAWLVALGLLGASGITGLFLVYKTSYVLLIIGVISALIAFFYSAGKIPISYYPISEFVSGFFEGVIVIVISSYLQSKEFTLSSILISFPIALSISNIMLANNITDILEDKKNKRKTLPIYLGKEQSIRLLIIITSLMFILTILYSFIGLLPMTSLLTVLIIPIIYQHIKIFITHTTKAKGFVMILKNSLIFNFVWILFFVIFFLLK